MGAKTQSTETEIDMTPMIDLVFLLIIFFILAGRISNDMRTEQITVPPTKTAQKLDAGKERIVINVFGTTKTGAPPRNSIKVNNTTYTAQGVDDYTAYQKMREMLDKAYDRADKVPDPKNPALKVPKDVVLEIRADADTEYRVVQEVLQVVCDSVDPFNGMLPKTVPPEQLRPFVAINYTSRRPGENK